jgi:hypothetical protein
MGLLLKLKDGDTLLKSLKFGNDRPGGGSSKQPYIQKSISDNPISSTGGNDFIIRGGIKAPQRALEDVARLAKYATDGVKGLLYTAKENLLSRTSVKTEASKGAAYAGGALNAGVYTPLSTLAQAGVGFTGIRLNRMGIDPTGLIPGLSLNKYEDVAKEELFSPPSNKNRLIRFLNEKQNVISNSPILYEYGGGPGSILGVGKTKIKFADQRTGDNSIRVDMFEIDDPRKGLRTFNTTKLLKNITSNPIYNIPNQSEWINIGEKISTKENNILKFNPSSNKSGSLYIESTGSIKLKKDPREGDRTFNTEILLKGVSTNPTYDIQKTGLDIGEVEKNIFNFTNSSTSGSLYKESAASKIQTPDIPKSNDPTLLQPNGNDTYVVAIDKKYNDTSKYLNKARIETRINLGDPGAVKGTWADKVTEKTQIIDKINGSPIYKTRRDRGYNHADYNDLIAFRIGVIDNANPNNTTYMNFRAYIDSFSDSYSSNWKDQSYMGRGEKFYKYEGFSRDISLSFTVVAQSQGEMNGMYQKLNYLASSLAPYYTGQGYMAGNLVKLTVGNYIYEQVGFISSITYDIPEESSWELSLTPTLKIAGKEEKLKNNANPDELPFMIKVTGFKFTPIHKFRPEINKYPENKELIVENRFITEKIPFKQNWQEGLKQNIPLEDIPNPTESFPISPTPILPPD